MVASSREDAWIETLCTAPHKRRIQVASSREDAWIETFFDKIKATVPGSRPPARTRGLKPGRRDIVTYSGSRVLPRGRVD